MIIKASQRGGAVQLAKHLTNTQDNEHIEIHSLNGFIAHDVHGALQEIYAISRATNAKQFMFSLSLSPPENANISIEDYEDAIERSIKAVGLQGQPHLILFHEKNGRRHCHVVVSRIDTHEMKAINLPFYKERLNEIARELFLHHEWELPKGFQDKSLSNPTNYTLEEYQVAKRAKLDPREIKRVLKDCWERSDSKLAFEAALQDKGFYLCRGDRRGFVLLDWQNNIYSLSRCIDQKPKILKGRLGEPDHLSSVEETKDRIHILLHGKQKEYQVEIETEFQEKIHPLETQKQRITEVHKKERKYLLFVQRHKRHQEVQIRSKRFRSGFRGLWDWVSGRHRKIQKQNAHEYNETVKRDRQEYHTLIDTQREHRRVLQEKIKKITSLYQERFFEMGWEVERSQTLYEKVKQLQKEQERVEEHAPYQSHDHDYER